ncbi:hypothetical protein ACEZ3G_13530 [Maribacter algicola]|uniref:Uncharacterized protein n=1 Tax=Meishania litoralis TaxID=3434685 RepID=A0ACC7LL78_9FLAO
MKQNYLRRNFLKNSLIASSGLMLFPSKVRPSISTMQFESGVLHVKDIRKKLFGKQIEISGQIFDDTGKNILRGVLIEFWHLSPDSKKLGHKGSLITDENGCYHILTDYPNREFGKHTTVHFKLSTGARSTLTELKFSGFGAYITDKHWESNRNLEDSLLFPKMEKLFYKTKINFNISINQ